MNEEEIDRSVREAVHAKRESMRAARTAHRKARGLRRLILEMMYSHYMRKSKKQRDIYLKCWYLMEAKRCLEKMV